MEYSPSSSTSLKQKIRSSICLSCCFRGDAGEVAGGDEDERPLSLIRSSSQWIRSKAQEQLPEIRDRYRGLVAGIRQHHRRHSADFRYDPLSYALNFDEGGADDDAALANDEFLRYRNFSSRLPASPPPAPLAATAVRV